MLSFIVRILLLALVIWLIRRFLAIFMGTAKRTGAPKTSQRASSHMVKDPVCGMYMDSRLAVRLETGGEVIYFCSEECKRKFLAKSSEDQSEKKASI